MKEILERLERKMDAGFAKVDGRFAEMDARLDTMDGRLDAMDGRFGEVDGQLQKQGVLLEAVRSDVKMALEAIAGNRQVMDEKFAEVIKKMDERIQPVELATRDRTSKGTKPR